MIEQVTGHRSYKWLAQQDSCPIMNFAHVPAFPLMTEVIKKEDEERVRSLGQNASYHWPEVIHTLPKPNNSMPQLESAPHVWHWRDTDTDVEFLMFSDGLRKNHYKGTSVEVLYKEDEHHKDDAKLSAAYDRLLKFVVDCYNRAQTV
jgi:hypothetical protein